MKHDLVPSRCYSIIFLHAHAPPQIAEKKKYAKYKANDILKAVKEGRQPTPGGPGGELDLVRTFTLV